MKLRQRRCTLTSTLSSGWIACRRALRRAGTMRCAKSIVIAKRLALRFAGRSTRSRSLNSATSKRAKLVESLDHYSTAAREPCQREGKHRSQDEGGQGSFGHERIAARID